MWMINSIYLNLIPRVAQSREEPGRETTEVPRGFAALCVRVQIA